MWVAWQVDWSRLVSQAECYAARLGLDAPRILSMSPLDVFSCFMGGLSCYLHLSTAPRYLLQRRCTTQDVANGRGLDTHEETSP